MVACLWQAMPEKNNMEVIWSVMESGTTAEDPDNHIGWGIPDYDQALNILTSIDSNQENGNKFSVLAYPLPFNTYLNLKFNTFLKEPVMISIMDLSGKVVFRKTVRTPGMKIVLNKWELNLTKGIYLLEIKTEQVTQTLKISVM
jgi:hypothetical protein